MADLATFSFLLCLSGCGGAALGLPDGGSGTDAGTSPDLGGATQSLGVPCGDTVCKDGAFCCHGHAASCGAFGCEPNVQANACDGPEDCPSGWSCCITSSEGFGTACATTCQPGFGPTGVICHGAADCGPSEECLRLEVAGTFFGCSTISR
jgi:hypothetical protein